MRDDEATPESDVMAGGLGIASNIGEGGLGAAGADMGDGSHMMSGELEGAGASSADIVRVGAGGVGLLVSDGSIANRCDGSQKSSGKSVSASLFSHFCNIVAY